MFDFAGKFFDVNPASVFSTGFSQDPIGQKAAVEMTQSVKSQAATIINGERVKVSLSLRKVTFDKSQILGVESVMREFAENGRNLHKKNLLPELTQHRREIILRNDI